MRAVLILFAASALAAAPAFAEDDDVEGFYFGVGVGDFSTGVDESSGVDGTNLDFQSDDTAQTIFAGWRFNRFMALQIDRVDFERSVNARDAGNIFSAEAEGFAPSFVGLLPLGPVELFARGGLLWYDLETGRNATAPADSRDRDPIFGAGIGFTIAERLNLRAEYEVVEIDGLDDPNAVWLTAAWRF